MEYRGAMLSDILLAYCRAGFEADAAAELVALAREHGMAARAEAAAGAAWLSLHFSEPRPADELERLFDRDALVFSRQALPVFARCRELPPGNRAALIAQAAKAGGERFREMWLESADTNEGKALSSLRRALLLPVSQSLLDGTCAPAEPGLPRLHVFLLSGSVAWLARGTPRRHWDWPMGIPRLAMPRQAPSRSALKLEEALLHLLNDDERKRRLKPGMRAVDLGAAPGGWSWQLARRGLQVTAVDNGPMAPAVLATGRVQHLRADGFRWRPRQRVDWLLCDMVERPQRVAELMARWVAEGYCRDALFNLKLPMKKRYAEVQRCRGLIADRLDAEGIKYRLRIKHLYHDREEVTAYLRRP